MDSKNLFTGFELGHFKHCRYNAPEFASGYAVDFPE